MSKNATLLLFPFLILSSLIMAESASSLSRMANFTAMAVIPPTPTHTQNFTYVLPNYNVTYTIKAMPPPDSSSVNPYAYNIVVYGPPPFPIQIDFYQQNRDNITEKVSVVMPTNSYSTSIGCTSYPTQITMKQIDNESVTPTPTSTPSPAATPPTSPAPTLTPDQEQQQIEKEAIIGAAIAVAVIGAGLGLLIYLIKRK